VHLQSHPPQDLDDLGVRSSTVACTPLARSTRPTICPKRPKPAMTTVPSSATISSAGRSGPRASARRGKSSRSKPINTSGVSNIDRATTAIMVATRPGAMTCAWVATENNTKANSPT